MTLKNSWDELQKGDWCFLNNDTLIVLRYDDDPDKGIVVLPIKETEHFKTIWTWNNDKEFPTLTPSILTWGNGRLNAPTWHGYLTDGKLVTV